MLFLGYKAVLPTKKEVSEDVHLANVFDVPRQSRHQRAVMMMLQEPVDQVSEGSFGKRKKENTWDFKPGGLPQIFFEHISRMSEVFVICGDGPLSIKGIYIKLES